jgi:3-deoxy-D-manno-octulosonic-acid transferase
MFTLSFWLYNVIIIPLLVFAATLAGFFNKKIAAGLAGRKSLFEKLNKDLKMLDYARPRVWFHVSSMGEFEQAKPVMAYLKAHFPHLIVILSFYSPSGFNHAAAYPHKDVVCYMPVDTWRQAGMFIRLIRPVLAVVVRHDIWPNHMWRLKKESIPAVLIDASISQKKVSTYKRFAFLLKPFFACFDSIFVVSEENRQRFLTVFPWPQRIHNCGDSRYDQVYQRAHEKGKIRLLSEKGIFQQQHCFIAGSIWPGDEKNLLAAVDYFLSRNKKNRVILAPHEINRKHIHALVSYFDQKSALYSQLGPDSDWSFRILIIDKIGLLANLYGFASLAFVGGGFGSGIHNVLEPAAHGCAVAFGPKYQNSAEAVELIKRKSAFLVKNSRDAGELLQTLVDDIEKINAYGKKAFELVEKNLGASECTVKKLEPYIS